MISFDTNLLLYSLNQDCAEYGDARAFFASLPTAPGTVVICDEVWRLAAQPNIGRRVVFDARLALTLRHHGVTEFATRNDSHFTGFGFSHLWNPLPH